jgi:Amt family ammonium transporter
MGAILTGLFAAWVVNQPVAPVYADAKKTGLFEGGHALPNQLMATLITWALAAIGSFILLKITDAVCGLRVSESEEYDGLDLTQHGESGYNFEEAFPGTVLQDGASSSAGGGAAAVARPQTKVTHA